MGQERALIATLHIRPVLRQRVQENQEKDQHLVKIKGQIQQGVETSFFIQDDMLMIGNRLCVPDVDYLHR